MVSSGCLNRRLVLAIVQTPSTRTLSMHRLTQLPPPNEWIRTITSSSNRQSGVSFGRENDSVIAPYLQKSSKNLKHGKRRTTEPAESDASDEYEIGHFVDRSTPNIRGSDVPSDTYLPVAQEQNRDLKQSGGARNSKTRWRNDQAVGNKQGSGYNARSNKISAADEDLSLRRNRARGGPKDARKADVNTSTNAGRPLMRKVAEEPEKWTIQKNALKEKFDDGWQPRKKLSPDAQEGIRGLHEQDPITYSTAVLAKQFKQSPEAIRRILKSKWASKIDPEKMQERRERWAKRHDRIWDAKAEIGQRPPRRRDTEVEDPDKFEQDLERRRILGEI